MGGLPTEPSSDRAKVDQKHELLGLVHWGLLNIGANDFSALTAHGVQLCKQVRQVTFVRPRVLRQFYERCNKNVGQESWKHGCSIWICPLARPQQPMSCQPRDFFMHTRTHYFHQQQPMSPPNMQLSRTRQGHSDTDLSSISTPSIRETQKHTRLFETQHRLVIRTRWRSDSRH